MPADPTKTPWEVIYGGILAGLNILGWLLLWRKRKREYLEYEPVTQIEFKQHIEKMESRFSQLDVARVTERSSILTSIETSIQSLRAELKAAEVSRRDDVAHLGERVDRIFERLPPIK